MEDDKENYWFVCTDCHFPAGKDKSLCGALNKWNSLICKSINSLNDLLSEDELSKFFEIQKDSQQGSLFDVEIKVPEHDFMKEPPKIGNDELLRITE